MIYVLETTSLSLLIFKSVLTLYLIEIKICKRARLYLVILLKNQVKERIETQLSSCLDCTK